MADKDTDMKVVVGAVADDASPEQAGKDIYKGVMKGIGNKGYIKLPVEVTKFKYPKRDEKALSGPRSVDYSNLQKAQDKLLSDWKKLSKSGFSSRDEDVFNVLKSFRDYQRAVKYQYNGKQNPKDEQVTKIRSLIGDQLNKYLTRLAPARLDNGKQGSFMNVISDSDFEKYAKSAIKRYKAAQVAGVDLSKSSLSEDDRAKILKTEEDLEKQSLAKRAIEQKKYEQKHSKEILKSEKKTLDKIKKEREDIAKNAIPIPKSDTPLEDVTLTKTEVKKLAEPRDYTPTRDDKKTNKHFYRELSRGVSRAVAGQFGSGINLGLRQPVMGGPFITQDSVEGVDKRGSFYGTNKAMSALYKEMPKIRRAEKRSLRLSRIRTGQAGEEDLAALREQDKKDAQENGRVYIDGGRNKNNLTDAEKSKGIAEAGLPELAKILGGIAHNRPDDTIKKFETYLDTITKLDLEGGTSNWDSIRKELDMTMAKFYNTRGTLGVAELPMKEGKIDPSIQIELDQVKATLKRMLKIFEDRLKGKAGQEAEELRQRREFVKITGKAPEDSVSSEKRGSQFDRITAEMSKNQAGIKKLTNATMVAAGDEDLADSRESKILQETQDEIIADASTGGNTTDSMNTLYSHMISTNRLLGEVKSILLSAFGGIPNGPSGTNRYGGGNDGTIPPFSNGIYENGNPNDQTKSILSKISQSLINIDVNVGNILQSIIAKTGYMPTNLPAIIAGQGVKTHPTKEREPIVDNTNYKLLHDQKVAREADSERTAAEVHNWVQKYVEADRKANAQKRLNEEAKQKYTGELEMSNVISSTPGFFGKLQDTISKAFSSQSEADRIMSMNRSQQARMRAQRLEIFGENRGRNLTDTGDKANVKRTKELFGWIYKNDGKNKELFQDIRLTPGFNKDNTIDTTKILNSLNKVLSGPEMFKAQTGGTLRNIIGSMTGYIGMPSIEKSRAEADGLNQVMSNVRNEMTKLVQSIQSKEMALKGMQEMGTARFDNEGRITEDSSSAARKTFIDLEEQKGVLRSALAEVAMIDQVVGSTGGKIHDIVKNLGFVMPELMENNTILQNINAGLDKNGKALKFQTRTAEILNYSFQLMARHIGQMVKNWLWMINPINLIQRAFQDFASYDTKWQRTMNVIKYNIRRIIKPFMEWLAQQIVNIIGLVNALVKGIGQAFGQNWDLFDKDAANAEKIKENLEAAADVSAGFDELHDIGSSNPAEDLSGDIYTPQWEGLNKIFEQIGKAIGSIVSALSGFNFWDWLVIGGAALVGFLALKWLLSLFKNGNPLQSVANGFSFLEKAVGWTLLIWAFTEFTKALTDFVECMKTADWEDIAKSLIMLGGAFALLFAGIAGVEGISKFLNMSTGELLGLSALVGVFDLFVAAIIPFIECIKDLGDEKIDVIASSLMTLAGAFIALIGGVAGVEGITKLLGLDWTSLLGLSAVVGALDLFVAAITPFIATIGEIDGSKWETIGASILGLVGAFIALASGVAVVSRAFSTMDWKAIGQLYVVAGAFELFMLVLIPFVNAIKDVPWGTLAAGAVLIAGAFISLGGAIAILGTAFKGMPLSAFAELLVLLVAFGAIIWVLKEFVTALQGLSSEQLIAGLKLLAGTIIVLAAAIGILAAVFTAVTTTGIGALALALLAVILGVFVAIIYAVSDFVRALGEAGEGIKAIFEGVATIIDSIANGIATTIATIGAVIIGIVETIANGIRTVLEPILGFIDSIISKVTDLAKTIAHEIGETIRTIIETTGNVIIGIIDSLLSAIPRLLDSILNFVREIGPAIENSVDAIMRSITKLINFVISGIEYMINTLIIGSINALLSKLPGNWSISQVSIPRFVPQYEQGTNYVPNDGLAYLHQGEAVVPKKYNQPISNGLTNEERTYMYQMMNTMRSLDNTMKQGINVNGQFVQRGSDLVAVVNKTKSRTGADVLSNVAYAR